MSEKEKIMPRGIGLSKRVLAATTAVAVGLQSVTASALPTGGQVNGGQATIAIANNSLNITQTSNRAIIDWSGFNIGSSEAVQFNQPRFLHRTQPHP